MFPLQTSKIVSMAITVRSFAKINLGLAIGALRPDRLPCSGDDLPDGRRARLIRVEASRGNGIEIRCKNPQVPCDETNTCYRVADRMLRHWKQRAKVAITIEKNLPVQGGLGAGSSNAVATMFALERELKEPLAADERLRIAAEVGSDLPLFLLGGSVLGLGRGEQVYPLGGLAGDRMRAGHARGRGLHAAGFSRLGCVHGERVQGLEFDAPR